MLFDDDGAAPVGRLQRIFSDKGISDYGERLGYPPHIALVTTDGVAVGALTEAADEFARDFEVHHLCWTRSHCS